MAMSFARPDPSSPASVADAGFGTSRRGFDQTEVRDFLRMVAAELGRLQERERFLERELRTAQTNPDLASAQLDEATLTRLLGEETARVLTTARESGAEIRQKAEQAAAQMVSEASDEAARMREEAEVEASRRRSDAAADAEAELSMAKQQGREMVNEARAYRERVLSELARRRELAREQIEQLLHGRDRLMQSFERARLVAIDVVSELQPLGEPDEYVNLAPTTGPVPVMVPNSPRPVETAPAMRADDTTTDDTATDDTTTDDIATDEVVDEVVIEEVDSSGDVEVVETVAEPAGESVADEAVAIVVVVDDDDDDDHDDVVVDLFARLRAESVVIEPAEELDDEIEIEIEDEIEIEAALPKPDAVVDVETTEVETSPFEQRDADLTPIIVAAARKLKRVLADEQNEVLETLRGKDPVRHLDQIVPSEADHSGRYADAIADELRSAAAAGAATIGSKALGKAGTTTATAAAAAVIGEWLVVPLRERLERCVLDGDGDNAGIGKRVRAVYREWKTQHIDEQLDDVVRTAHGRGVLGAIGAGTAVVWMCDPSHPVCADCDDNSLAGTIAAGDAFPTGHVCTPAHIGCRCMLLPDGR
jgi:DivIVA domain-containing protein